MAGVEPRPTLASSGMVRVSHPELSLWQSAVRQVVASRIARGDITDRAVANHQIVCDTDDYVRRKAASGQIPLKKTQELAPDDNPFEIALAHARSLVDRLEDFAASIGKFNNLDPLFIECIFEFLKYYWLAHLPPPYRDWRAKGGDINFGVVRAPIAETAKVAVIGDWGTGMNDAEWLLAQVLKSQQPDVLIHLGDIYYSGTASEVHHNFESALARAEQSAGMRGLRVHSIPGNHDYYSGGHAFYGLIDALNDDSTRQSGSYFCLRTTAGAYQFVGVDTGFNDRSPGLGFTPSYVGPVLQDSEAEWLRNKIETFDGRTFLFSHHQAFSAHSAVNGPESRRPQYLNQPLIDSVGPQGRDRVVAWFWGHEHNLAMFDNDQYGVMRGRLVGCSAFETPTEDDPYKQGFPEVKVQPPRLARLGDWLNHACAVIDLGAKTITYWQVAAWTDDPPNAMPELTAVVTELFDA